MHFLELISLLIVFIGSVRSLEGKGSSSSSDGNLTFYLDSRDVSIKFNESQGQPLPSQFEVVVNGPVHLVANFLMSKDGKLYAQSNGKLGFAVLKKKLQDNFSLVRFFKVYILLFEFHSKIFSVQIAIIDSDDDYIYNLISLRKLSSQSANHDYLLIKQSKELNETFHGIREHLLTSHQRAKRANPATGQPFNLNIGVMIVTDYSIYLKHQQYLQTTTSGAILTHMKIYFAYYINELNKRLNAVLSADADLRLNLVVVGTQFLTVIKHI